MDQTSKTTGGATAGMAAGANAQATKAPAAPGFLDTVRDEIDKFDSSLDQLKPLLVFIPLMGNLINIADSIRAAVDRIDPKTS